MRSSDVEGLGQNRSPKAALGISPGSATPLASHVTTWLLSKPLCPSSAFEGYHTATQAKLAVARMFQFAAVKEGLVISMGKNASCARGTHGHIQRKLVSPGRVAR